ncbi:MAG: butyrate kinase [Planctomycetes bacterium]|nr:butyrate kinase [Planctomycetota bacterium]
MKPHRVLVINPGSTSTKVAVFENTTPLCSGVLRHGADELKRFARIRDQLEFRSRVIEDQLAQHGVDAATLDAVIGRGGVMRPVRGGVLAVDDAMLADLEAAAAGEHASNLGALIAARMARRLGIPAFVADPIVVDELDEVARISGMPEIERISIFHALNQKATGRRAARELGRAYADVNLIVAHMGGGITVGAHRRGRVVDVNNGLNGDGPFAPERAGGLPSGQLARLCFSGRYTEPEILAKITGQGGLVAYLGTSDAREVAKMIDSGDPRARLIYGAMAYQVAKEIGAMAAVLSGGVDGIVLTGGLAHDARLVKWITDRVSFIARVFVYEGEDEMEALRDAALRVLAGEEEAASVSG